MLLRNTGNCKTISVKSKEVLFFFFYLLFISSSRLEFQLLDNVLPKKPKTRNDDRVGTLTLPRQKAVLFKEDFRGKFGSFAAKYRFI